MRYPFRTYTNNNFRTNRIHQLWNSATISAEEYNFNFQFSVQCTIQRGEAWARELFRHFVFLLMFNKWFWLELRWAVIVNGFGGLILSSFIAITLVPIITYHLWVNTHELHNSRVPGIPVVNGKQAIFFLYKKKKFSNKNISYFTLETSLLAKALIMVMVNALLLCGYYKVRILNKIFCGVN